MQRMPWAILLWPGLPQLWLRGEWAGLAKALGAALLLNAALLCSFGWSELINSSVRNLFWVVVGLIWAISAVGGYLQAKRQGSSGRMPPAEDPFRQALDLYLKGDHFQAECLLVEMLGRNERDLDVRLLLATLYRHNRRYDEAVKQLDTLARYEGSEKWSLEIDRERMLIDEGRNAAEEEEELPAIEPRPRISQAA
jgi:hypothetical protein